ncbi:MAG: dihydrofolate reductase family protein [Solirubrobacteraceae bacterium]
MGKVYTGASMSLDGYIAGYDGSGFDQLFQWYGNGDVSVPTADPGMTFSLTPESAAHWAAIREQTAVLVVGRRLFDFTNGWNGNHPLGLPVVVVTHAAPEDWAHPDAPFTFVSGGIEAAIARAQQIAGDKVVAVNGGTIASQCAHAGLLDEVWVDLVPVVLGGGVPLLRTLGAGPIVLDGPLEHTQGNRVTHLRFAVRKG